MLTQQDIYAAGYVLWSSPFLRYAKSKPNGKLIYNSILNVVRKTTQEIWLRVQQMMKGSDIGIQDKKAKLFNEWEGDLKRFEEVNATVILMANVYQRHRHRRSSILSYSSPLPEPHQVQQNDSNVIYEDHSVVQGGRSVEHHSATVEETRACHESLFHNLATEVEKVNSVNRKMKETNAELTIELARYKKSRKSKQITALNTEISNLNNQLLKENSTVSSLLKEKKKLKSDFKIHEDELLDKQI
ncbi:hypothetical protein Tco_0073305 [Tanacetum coccineum]